MKQSEKITIKRSEIVFNPDNIKRHSQDAIKSQKANIRKVGYLGGIVYNTISHNLIDGHRRLLALDEIHKYDGTPETDYEIGVEAIALERKEELEQMSYMALANTKADYNLLASIIDEIDYKSIGLSEDEYNSVLDLRISTPEELEVAFDMETIEDIFAPKVEEPKEEYVPTPQPAQTIQVTVQPTREEMLAKPQVTELPKREITNEEFQQRLEEKPKMTKEEVKEQKKHCANVNTDYMDNVESYIIINCKNMQVKTAFCDIFSLSIKDNMVVDAEELIEKLEEM